MGEIIIYSREDKVEIQKAASAAAHVLDLIGPHVKVGVTTQHINDLCHKFIEEQGAIPATLNYKGFKKSICVSVNEEVCHGIPGERVLKEGDIVNVDVSVNLNGWYGDTSRIFLMEPVSQEHRDLAYHTKMAMHAAIERVKPGVPLNTIGATIENYFQALRNRKSRGMKFGIVREFCGHGIGREFQHAPKILHYKNEITTPTIQPGMCFTIEPMVNLGEAGVKILSDGWTAVTVDGSFSAQWEHMVFVTESGREILT